MELNVTHCLLCDKYFIHNDNYERYRKRYGLILGQIKYVDHDISDKKKTGDENEMNLKDESTLHLFGYNVQKRNHLSMVERQNIIVNVIEMKAMEKHEVTNLLTNLIRRNKSKIDAVEAWSEDLEFVQDYDIENQRHIGLYKIVPYCRNRFVSLHRPIATQGAIKRCINCRFAQKVPDKIQLLCSNCEAPRYQSVCEMCAYFEAR